MANSQKKITYKDPRNYFIRAFDEGDISKEELYALYFFLFLQLKTGNAFNVFDKSKTSDMIVNKLFEKHPRLLTILRHIHSKENGELSIQDFYSQMIKMPTSVLEEYLLYGFFEDKRYFGITSKPVSDLMLHFLKVDGSMDCADFCSGVGTLTSELVKQGAKKVDAIEMAPHLNAIAEMRHYVCLHATNKNDNSGNDHDLRWISENIFQFSIANPKRQYDCIVSHFPWNHRLNKEYDDILENVFSNTIFSDVKINRNSDWKYIALAAKHLKPSGRAYLLTTLSIELKTSDQDIREFFVRQGLIEKVIRLPAGVHSGTSVVSLLVILSHNNKGIEFIDATNAFQKIGRQWHLNEKYVEKMKDASQGLIHFKTTKEVLKAKRLDPKPFVIPAVTDGRPLQEIAEVFGGTALKKDFLDKNLRQFNNRYELIRLSDIKYGMIVSSHFLESLPENSKILQKGDILVTRTASRIEVVLYDEESDSEVIIDENFLVVRCKNRLDALYVYAYLSSSVGQEQLRANYKGVVISKMKLQDLKSLLIPKVSKVEKEEIAVFIEKKQKEIENNYLQMNLSLEEKQDFLDYSFGGVTDA